jgi:hypothetical protein
MSSSREVSLLNLILSFNGQRGRDTRALIRSKFFVRSLNPPGYRHLFVIGGTNELGCIRQDELWLPSDDTYWGGPSKVIDAFQYVVEHEADVGSYAYYLKSDDDTIVCIDQLMAWLQRGSLPWTHAYAGQLQANYGDLHYWRQKDKFYDQPYITAFNRSVYPPYMLGGGYLLSRDTVQYVVSSAAALGFLQGGRWRTSGQMPHMEDAFIGTLVGTYAAHYDLPIAANAFEDNFKLEIRFPEKFCRYLVYPKLLCNRMRGKAWCKEHGPLVIMHPYQIFQGNVSSSSVAKLPPAWRMARHAKLVSNKTRQRPQPRRSNSSWW